MQPDFVFHGDFLCIHILFSFTHSKLFGLLSILTNYNYTDSGPECNGKNHEKNEKPRPNAVKILLFPQNPPIPFRHNHHTALSAMLS